MASNHAACVGKLICNLQSLEFAIRIFLYQHSNPAAQEALGFSFEGLKVGDVVQENAITDYSTLEKLIKKYNSIVALRNPDRVIDPNIVSIRDLFAHGRLSALVPDESALEMIIFSKPIDGKVKVVQSVKMTDEWMQERIDFIRSELIKINMA